MIMHDDGEGKNDDGIPALPPEDVINEVGEKGSDNQVYINNLSQTEFI